MSARCTLAALLALVAATAHGGSRARYGGTLRVSAITGAQSPTPLSLANPVDAAVLALTHSAPCRLAELSFPSATVARLVPLGGATAEALLGALTATRSSSTAYRALLASVKSMTLRDGALELTLETPQPELSTVLCHPALALPGGPFAPANGTLTANVKYPVGRPYVDAAAVQRVDARAATRLLAQGRAHAVLGVGTDSSGPQLFATYLAYQPTLGAHFRDSVEASVDRADLIRFFVRPPATPMPGLLPIALTGPQASVTRPEKPAPRTAPQELRLLFDTSSSDHRAVAERLQVKLQPMGYRVVLVALEHDALVERWSRGEGDALLQTVLLPPAGAPALSVALAVANAAAPLLPVETAPRDAMVKEQATALLKSVPLVPLYTQGLAVGVSDSVARWSRDAYGLPQLDDVFLLKDEK